MAHFQSNKVSVTGASRWLGFAILVIALATLGYFYVPAHWTSVWMDREFSDWVSPVANRLQGAARLYGPGLHFPMPPLPYVFVRVLFPHGANWIEENLLNFLFVAAVLLLLYVAFAKLVGVGCSFAAALAAIPIFFSLPKTILYDSMAQFLVAVCGVVAAAMVGAKTAAGEAPARIGWPLLALQGFALGLLMLTKQSTGAGVVLGVCAMLCLLPAGLNNRQRFLNLVQVLGFMGLTMLVVSLALSPLVDFRGMVRDVFLTGSETKGSGGHLLSVALAYVGRHLRLPVTIALGYFIISWVCDRTSTWRTRLGRSGEIFFPNRAAGEAASASQTGVILAACAATAGCFVVINYLPAIHLSGMTGMAVSELNPINFGCAGVIFLVAFLVAGLARGGSGSADRHPLAAYALVFVPASIFHNLSATNWRWSYDNNPLIVLALAMLMAAMIPGRLQPKPQGDLLMSSGKMILFSLCFLMIWINTKARAQFEAVKSCVEAWPEIPHLAGARLRPEAAGMRSLVAQVQAITGPPGMDSVLLLPDDPNVESWLARPRPALAGAIIFTDQYWDCFVDGDFAELQAHSPKVIIVGPRNYWRLFFHMYHVNWGAERLIDLVRHRLLPANYDLRLEQPIIYQGGKDFMDVYVLRDRVGP